MFSDQVGQSAAEIALLQDQLTGALIGLARAAAGNEELVTDHTYQLVREALSATADSADVPSDSLRDLLAQTAAEKAALAPNCANCDHPCGKTADYDMASLWNAPEDVRSLKSLILFGLRSLAASGCTDEAADAFLLRTLDTLGNEWDLEDLLAFALKVGEVHLRLAVATQPTAADSVGTLLILLHLGTAHIHLSPELQALVSPGVQQLLAERGITLLPETA